MRRCSHVLFVLLVSIFCLTTQLRAESIPTGVQSLVEFDSEEGWSRLARSSAKVDFLPLANQFEGQSNIAFCGPTTAAIVLNALSGPNPALPRDRSRLHPEDSRYLPPGLNPALPRHTQESVILRSTKTRAQIFGEPHTVHGKTVRDGGFQLRQLDQMLRAHGLATTLVVVDESRDDESIRRELIDNLRQLGDFVIVNYRREAIGQTGGGHISPLGAYDAGSDSVLMLDVNPSLYRWTWVTVSTLIKGMRTFDSVENRGYILIRRP